MRWLLGFVVFWIIYGSLYPFHFSPVSRALFVWEQPAGLSAVRDLVINVGLYFPAGFLAFYGLSRPVNRFGKVLVVLFFGLLFSALMEFLQAFDVGRVSSAVDICANGAGAMLGAVAASAFAFRFPALWRWRANPEPVVLLLMTAGGHLYPFFPRVHWGQFTTVVREFAGSFREPRAVCWQAVFFCIQWLVVGWLLGIVLSRKSQVGLSAIILLIPAGFFVVGQSPTAAEVAGGVLALGLYGCWNPGAKLRALILVVDIVLVELFPFQFSAFSQAFEWLPFAPVLGAGTPPVAIVLNKLFLYSSAVWLLDAAWNRLLTSTVALSALMLGLELLQCYLPGRTPESSDAVMMLGAGIACWVWRWQAGKPVDVHV